MDSKNFICHLIIISTRNKLIERDTIYHLPRGSREFYVLKDGDEYNLKTSSVNTYKTRDT